MNIKLAPVSPQAERWGDFDCGDAQITAKLVREAARADVGLQNLYGALMGEQVVGAMTLRRASCRPRWRCCGNWAGGPGRTHRALEVLAVRQGWQRQGVGQAPINCAVALCRAARERVAVKTLSLEATRESWRCYAALGFASADPWPDGSRPMWLDPSS